MTNAERKFPLWLLGVCVGGAVPLGINVGRQYDSFLVQGLATAAIALVAAMACYAGFKLLGRRKT